MNLERRILIVAVIASLVLPISAGAKGPKHSTGQASGQTTTAQTTSSVQKPAKTDTTYALNVVVSGVPFWKDTRETWEAIGKTRPDLKLLFSGPKDVDAQKQVDEIEALINKGVSGLVIYPADPAALVPVINKAVDKGVNVITYLTDAPTSKRLTYVTSEIEEASKRIAEYMTKKSGYKGKVIISFAKAGNDEQEARRRGFEEFIKAHPGMELVGVVEDYFDENKGSEALKPLLTRHPNLNYIFGTNSRSAIGAVSALRELGIPAGQVQVGGWDMDKDVLDLIQKGWVQGSVAQQSAFMTNVIFSILDAKKKGYLYPMDRSYQENGVSAAPDKIVIPVSLVTPENVKAFYPKNQKK